MAKPVPSLLPPPTAQVARAGVAETGDESLGYLIRHAHRAFVKALAQALEPHGISTGEWSALRVLWVQEGVTQVELAERMRVEKASLTPVLSSLEAKGLVARTRNIDDRRKINLKLTAAGRRLETRVIGAGLAVNDIAAHGLPPAGMQNLRTLLGAVINNLDGNAPARPRP